MHIVVIDDYQNAFRTSSAFPKLKDHDVTVYTDTEKDPARLAERLKDAEVVVLTQQRSPLPRAVIERCPRLRLISQTGRNVAHVDLAAAKEKGITVSAGGGGIPHPTAELTWGLILAHLRHIPQEVQALKDGRWQSTVGTGLKDRTLGVYAFGKIGSLVAAVGRAFGMNVLCLGREGSVARAREAGFEATTDRAAFFAAADIVTVHLPLNKDTRGIITAEDLGRMKPTAVFVNTSRAPIVAEGALVAALKAGRPGSAAIDVYESEPVLGADHPLIAMPNVTCTPHLGYVETRNYEAIYSTAVDQILAYAEGKPINVVA